MERQTLLTGDNPLHLWAIMDEAAVRRVVGGRTVMRAQLARLQEAAALPHVTVQVIPYEAGAHPRSLFSLRPNGGLSPSG
jgi:hypothetical protein